MPRQNPYQMLMEEAREYMAEVECPRKVPMWRYPKKSLNSGWNLTDLYERVAAAAQLGYEVVLESNDEGLSVFYKTKRPERPWRFR